MPFEFALELDARVLAFASACVALVMAFGLWPCTRPARSAAVSSVQQSTNTSGRTRERAVAGRVMLIAQLGACTVLLIGAGLLWRTVSNLRSQELGFDRNVLLVSLSPGQAGYSEQAAAMLLQRVRERLSAVPGIQAIGMSGPALLDPTNYWIDRSQRLTTDRGMVLPDVRWTFAAVGAGYFEAVGMSIVNGRTFEERDAQPPADAVVINRSLATVLFANESPIGRRFRMSPRGPMQSVIGVVNDAKQTSPRDRTLGVVYVPLRGFNHVVLAVRTAGPPADAAAVVRHQLSSIAGDLPIEKVRTIAEVLDTAIAQERLMSAIALFLAAMVIAIGCVGLYALMSYDVERRTHELGVRLALGATNRNVVTMVLRDSAGLVLPGLAIGVPLGIAASRPLTSQLYGVETHDPWTLASVALVLTVVALLATFRPAQKASRIDPIALLRSE
jgi:predicted permease